MTKANPKRSAKPTKMPIMALSKIEEKEITLDSDTLTKLQNILTKSGGRSSGLTISDVITHLLLEKGSNGFKFEPKENIPQRVKLSLPAAAWRVAEKSAKKSGDADLSEVVKVLVSKS